MNPCPIHLHIIREFARFIIHKTNTSPAPAVDAVQSCVGRAREVLSVTRLPLSLRASRLVPPFPFRALCARALSPSPSRSFPFRTWFLYTIRPTAKLRAHMLAMNAPQLFNDARQRPPDRMSHSSHISSSSSSQDTTTTKDRDEDDDVDVVELDPVDGFPSPPVRVRPRRRFVKAGKTTYELSFSRRHVTNARRGAAVVETATADADESDGLCDMTRPAPVVSSLSHVLTEVLSGQTKALNNIVDTTPVQPNVTYVVEHAADGTPYVAASDGTKYFENSAIGQIFLQSARAKGHVRGRRSDQSVGLRPPQPQETRRSDGELTPSGTLSTCTAAADGAGTGETAAVGLDGDVKRGLETRLAFRGFHVRKWKEQKKGAVADTTTVSTDGAAAAAATGAGQDAAGVCMERERARSSLDKLDRDRADASCDVPPTVSQAGYEATASGTTGRRVVDVNSSSDGGGGSVSTTKTLPRLQPKKEVPAPPLAPDAYDEQDNPLCRSFQNVRNVDLVRAKARTSDDDDEHDRESDDRGHEHDDEHEDVATAGDDDVPDADSPDFAGRVRVSSGATSVADFVGGFKGQLCRRSGASGLVNRKRAVRHARLSAEEQKAADLARKIREAHNRVPLEFRDEHMSFAALMEIQKKRKENQARGRHVSFNPDVLCREFEVVSEDEDDGYDSPDEIVDAVQLVSKRDVVRAEDVVATFPMEQLGLPSEALAHDVEASASPGSDGDAASVQKDPLTFSAVENDKRMSFSEL
uniref:Uncharacterized protein n=1 Tax=Peronospora matthiolae TaxID=2874970 RepID=A0AAV1V5B5_9STRA